MQWIWGCRDGKVVRAPASHHCSQVCRIPGPGVTCGLTLLLVFVPAPSTKTKFQLDPETRAIGLSASLNNVIYFIWINNIPSRVRGGGGGRQSYSQLLCKYNHHTITLHYTFTLICTCTCTGYIANMLKGFKTWILDMKHSSSLEEQPLIGEGKL